MTFNNVQQKYFIYLQNILFLIKRVIKLDNYLHFKQHIVFGCQQVEDTTPCQIDVSNNIFLLMIYFTSVCIDRD